MEEFKYQVSFEFDLRPVLTQEGTVRSGNPHTGAHRAIKLAKKALRPNNWRSLVCVLERTRLESDQGETGSKE